MPWSQTPDTCKYLTLYLNCDDSPLFETLKIELYLSLLSVYTVAWIDSIMYIGHPLVLFHIEKKRAFVMDMNPASNRVLSSFVW